MTASFTHDAPGTPARAWREHAGWAAVVEEPALDPGAFARVVVVAAHPDDESLGAAGTVARARRAGVPAELVLVTAGEHSHPGSPTLSPTELAARRRVESQQAWRELGTTGDPHHLGVEDGAVAASADEVTRRLVDLLGDARDTLVLAPWRHDGHPDHEAAGHAAAAACRRTGATLREYPIWFWHHARPDDAPWGDLVAVRLDDDDRARKQRAIAAHRTQVAPLSPAAGDETLLGAAMLEHFAGSHELFVHGSVDDAALDRAHAEQNEPWGADERWYEERKRALTLACLPARSYVHALELGCSTGVLAADLATRCDRLLAVDASPTALERATARLRDLPGVRTRLVQVPQEWPDDDVARAGRFDLVVVSEVGYFLSPADLEHLAERIASTATPDACVVLCHWRHPVEGWVLDGGEVHERLVARLDLPVIASYRDRDVEILVLGAETLMPEPSA